MRFRLADAQIAQMTVQEVTPNVDTDALLAGAQFVDAFRVEIADRALDARQARTHDGRQPRWVDALVKLRNILVTPFGSRPRAKARRRPAA